MTSMREYDVEVHLSEGDVAVDSTKNLQWCRSILNNRRRIHFVRGC